MSEYKCCFDDSKNCSVRNMWKLKPESLVEFCKICNGKVAQFDLDQSKLMVDFFNMLITGEKMEKAELRKMLFDLIQRPKEKYVPIHTKTKLRLPEEDVCKLLENAKYWDEDEAVFKCATCHNPIEKGQKIVFILGHPLHANCIEST